MKTLILAALATTLSFGAAQAMDMKCDQASMDMVMAEADKASAEKKEMAMKHMDMAKAAMTAQKTEECTMHMQEASKAVMK